MAMPSRGPGGFGKTFLRTLLYPTVCLLTSVKRWFSYSSGHLPGLHDYLLKSGLTGTHVTSDDLFALPYFAISRDRVAKATLWERQAAGKAFGDTRKKLDPQGRERTALKWRQ